MIKIKFLISILKSYKKKLIKIFFFEIYYSIKYLLSGNYYKIQNDNLRTDTIPCPYFFIHKISQFINKKKIRSLIDLGCGFGRITNFLSDSTNAAIYGYEVDNKVFDIAIKNKKKNVSIKYQDILSADYNSLYIECFVLNDPLKREIDLENLIKKIELNKYNFNQKYYLITINIDEKKNYIFKKYKLLKMVFASSAKNVKFYSN